MDARYAVDITAQGRQPSMGLPIAAGLGPGDEAITTPLHLLRHGQLSVLYTGAKPVFADVCPPMTH